MVAVLAEGDAAPREDVVREGALGGPRPKPSDLLGGLAAVCTSGGPSAAQRVPGEPRPQLPLGELPKQLGVLPAGTLEQAFVGGATVGEGDEALEGGWQRLAEVGEGGCLVRGAPHGLRLEVDVAALELFELACAEHEVEADECGGCEVRVHLVDDPHVIGVEPQLAFVRRLLGAGTACDGLDEVHVELGEEPQLVGELDRGDDGPRATGARCGGERCEGGLNGLGWVGGAEGDVAGQGTQDAGVRLDRGGPETLEGDADGCRVR